MSFVSSARMRLAVRVLGALLLLFVGLDHYYEYSARDYSVIPTIGTLFLLNFLSATAVAALLLTPLERLSRRFGARMLPLVAASGAAIAATSLVGLLVSEQTKLFGFMELNYRPEIVVALISEAAATLVLVALTWLTASAARSVADRPARGLAIRWGSEVNGARRPGRSRALGRCDPRRCSRRRGHRQVSATLSSRSYRATDSACGTSCNRHLPATELVSRPNVEIATSKCQ